MCTPVFLPTALPKVLHHVCIAPADSRTHKKNSAAMGRKLAVSPAATDAKTATNDGAASAFSAGADVGMASAVTASGGGQPPDLFNALFGGDGSNIPPAISPAAISSAQNFIRELPLEVRQAAEDSYSARSLLYTILLARKNDGCRKMQLAQLRKFADPGVYEMVLRLFPHIIGLSRPLACLWRTVIYRRCVSYPRRNIKNLYKTWTLWSPPIAP